MISLRTSKENINGEKSSGIKAAVKRDDQRCALSDHKTINTNLSRFSNADIRASLVSADVITHRTLQETGHTLLEDAGRRGLLRRLDHLSLRTLSVYRTELDRSPFRSGTSAHLLLSVGQRRG